MLDKISKVFKKNKFKGQSHRLGADEKPLKSPGKPTKEAVDDPKSDRVHVKRPFQGRAYTLRDTEPSARPSATSQAQRTAEQPQGSSKPGAPTLRTGDDQAGVSTESLAAAMSGTRLENGGAEVQTQDAATQDRNLAALTASDETMQAITLLQQAPAGGTDTLKKILANILQHPGEAKYRRIRLANPRIQAAVVDLDGGLELLQACGFIVDSFDTEDVQCYLPEDEELVQLSAALTLLGHKILGQSPDKGSQGGRSSSEPSKAAPSATSEAQKTNASAAPCDRETQVVLPNRGDLDVPEWVYERSPAELKAAIKSAQKRREQNEVLMTRAMREKLQAGGPKPNYSKSRVRVRMPEGLLLQGRFNAGEPVARIFEWVTDCLADPSATYELVLPDRRPLAVSMGSVRSADLVPAVLLNFRISALGGPQRLTLRPEILATVRESSD